MKILTEFQQQRIVRSSSSSSSSSVSSSSKSGQQPEQWVVDADAPPPMTRIISCRGNRTNPHWPLHHLLTVRIFATTLTKMHSKCTRTHCDTVWSTVRYNVRFVRVNFVTRGCGPGRASERTAAAHLNQHLSYLQSPPRLTPSPSPPPPHSPLVGVVSGLAPHRRYTLLKTLPSYLTRSLQCDYPTPQIHFGKSSTVGSSSRDRRCIHIIYLKSAV